MGEAPPNTDLLDHRYLETANADIDVSWCDRQLSQLNYQICEGNTNHKE